MLCRGQLVSLACRTVAVVIQSSAKTRVGWREGYGAAGGAGSKKPRCPIPWDQLLPQSGVFSRKRGISPTAGTLSRRALPSDGDDAACWSW